MQPIVKPNYWLYIILGFLTIVFVWLIRAYLGLFFLSLVLTMVFDPLYARLNRLIKHPMLASIVTTLIIIFLVLIPFIILAAVAVSQAIVYFNYLSQSFNPNHPVIQYLLSLANQFPLNSLTKLNFNDLNRGSNIFNLVGGSLSTIGSFIFNNLIPIITFSVQAIAQTVFFFVFVVYLFPFRQQFFQGLAKISPLNQNDHRRFLDRFEAVTVTTMKAMVVVGCVQGFLGGLMLAILHFPAAAFWGFVMAVISIIPLGSGVVWVPISILMVLNGHWVQGVILFLWGILVISSIDNIIRAKLLSGGRAQMPEILTLLGVLGGVNSFGLFGFIYGPAIVSLFYTAITLFAENKAKYLRR